MFTRSQLICRFQSPLGAWQAKVWDPEVGSTEFDQFCEALDQPLHKGEASALAYDPVSNLVSIPGDLRVDLSVFNYAKYIKEVSTSIGLHFIRVTNSIAENRIAMS